MKINDVLTHAIQGTTSLITTPGMICIDFADVKAVIMKRGEVLMSTATAVGQNRAKRAVENALSSSRLNSEIMHEARGLLVNIRSGRDLTVGEYSTISDAVYENASDSAIVVVGSAMVEPSTQGEIQVTIVATGLGESKI